MERQSKEESIIMWQLELNSAEKVNLSESHKRMLEVVTEKINDYTLTYEEYVKDIMDIVSTFEDTDNLEERKKQIDGMCETLIEKYENRSEEVR